MGLARPGGAAAAGYHTGPSLPPLLPLCAKWNAGWIRPPPAARLVLHLPPLRHSSAVRSWAVGLCSVDMGMWMWNVDVLVCKHVEGRRDHCRAGSVGTERRRAVSDSPPGTAVGLAFRGAIGTATERLMNGWAGWKVIRHSC